MDTIQTEVSGVSRDIKSGGLISTNYDALAAYKKKKNMNKMVDDMKKDHMLLCHRVEKIESNIEDIKSLLLQLVK